MRSLGTVGVISLEPWDGVWRRNQHLATQLIAQGVVEQMIFIEPATSNIRAAKQRVDGGGLLVVRPALRVPKRMGGLYLLGRALARGVLRPANLLWINDPTLGVHAVNGKPAIYDVTDDWRSADRPARIRRRVVRAEDQLATRANTVVCSAELGRRWHARYGVESDLIQNAVDRRAFNAARSVHLHGSAPHIGYVGTLHEDRLDLDLLSELGRDPRIGTVHLVGPNALSDASVSRLQNEPKIVLHGAVPAIHVPGWMIAMDVLISPHLVDDFTLSLDAIKAHEYAAARRPVVATPTSGFQLAQHGGWLIVNSDKFVDAVADNVGGAVEIVEAVDWSDRAAKFAEVMDRALYRFAF